MVPGFYSKKNSSAKTARSTSSRKPPIVVAHKEGPSLEILRTEKETEVHFKVSGYYSRFSGDRAVTFQNNSNRSIKLEQSVGANPKLCGKEI